MALPDPVKVSPLIKLARYAFLISGIVYGATRLNLFKGIAAGEKDQKERIKKQSEMHVADEKRKTSDRDISAIAGLFNDGTFSAKEPKAKEAKPERKDVEGIPEAKELKKEQQPADQVNEDQNKQNIEDKSTAGILAGGDDYHVETFSKGVPYASPKKEKADFLPKL